MKFESYWLDTVPAIKGLATGEVEGRADVIVIGGGLTGLSAALSLVKFGADVVVLEAGRMIGEASGRNGGQCNTGLLQDYLEVVKQYGEERARGFYTTFCAAVDTVERVVREERIDCDFARVGKLKLAAKPEHVEKLALTFDMLRNSVDPDVRLLSQSDLGNEIDSDIFHGGLLQPGSASLHVGRFGAGLAEASLKRGARLFESTPVTGIKRESGGGFRVTTHRGTLQAKYVLVATGCTTNGGPFGWIRRRIVPVGSFIIVTEPLTPDAMDALLPKRRNYVTTMNIGNYFRPTSDNRLLFGGRARFAMSNKKSDAKSGRILGDMMSQVFPQLRETEIDYCWGGLVDMTQDRFPRAGERNGMHYSMGYSGHGVQMSVHMGQAMADAMNGRPELNPWKDLRWPAIPGHFGPPWFLPFVGAYYRVKDRLS
ncbi:MAG TPA: FAD-binding oxidoreductase [Woeseiaceae bacterium]|nr:FAD-binding oxidoreductase [Woeseiaceae bacterium]